MKKRLFLGFPAVLTVLCILLAAPAGAADGLYRLMHNGQDALVLGEVAKADATGVSIEARGYIVSAKDLNADAPVKQLRPETAVLPPDTRFTLYGSGGKAGVPQKGDFVLASLNRAEDGWKIAWGLYRVSGTDPETLSVLYGEDASEDMRMEAAAVGAFVRSGGTVTEFSFDGDTGLVKSGGEIVYDARETASPVLSPPASPDAPAVARTTPSADAPSPSGSAPSAENPDGAGKKERQTVYGAAALGILVSAALLLSTIRRARRK